MLWRHTDILRASTTTRQICTRTRSGIDLNLLEFRAHTETPQPRSLRSSAPQGFRRAAVRGGLGSVRNLSWPLPLPPGHRQQMLNDRHVNDAIGIQVWVAGVRTMPSAGRPSENRERGWQSTPDMRCRSRRSDEDDATYKTASRHPKNQPRASRKSCFIS